MALGRHSAKIGVLADSLSESEATRRVLLVSGGLVLLGLVLLVVTIWWWRSTKAEHPSLGPLEVMSARRWWRTGHAERNRLLERARPAGAGRAETPEPEPVDLSVLAAGDHAGFDDLREIDLMLGLQLPGSVPVVDGADASADEPEPVDADAVAARANGDRLDEADAGHLAGDDERQEARVEDTAAGVGAGAEAAAGADAAILDVGDAPADASGSVGADDAGNDEDEDLTVAIDGGDMAALLVRDGDADASRRHPPDVLSGDLGEMSLAEAHDLEHLTDLDEAGSVNGATAPESGGPDAGTTIDPLLQRTPDPD